MDWHLWYLLGRLITSAAVLFVALKYGVPLFAGRAWNRADRREDFDAFVAVVVEGLNRDVPPAAIVEHKTDAAQDLGPDRAALQRDHWAIVVAQVRDVYVQFSLNDGTFGYMVSAQPAGPWQSLEHLVHESGGLVTDRDDTKIQYLASCAKLHVANWDVVRDALLESTAPA